MSRLTVIAPLILGWVILGVGTFLSLSSEPEVADPHDYLPRRAVHYDHTALFDQPFPDGPAVTTTCLQCHDRQAHEVMRTSHWTWEKEMADPSSGGTLVRLGKKNAVNNFCIGVQSNWPRCTSCHAGYGWADEHFDFNDATKVDCLVCHDRSGVYAKAQAGAGHPEPGIDLLASARSVGSPGRANCGSCHFSGGGGNAVKHGDLDSALLNPTPELDVHMGKHNFVCQDCHRSKEHRLRGRSFAVSLTCEDCVRCEDCHQGRIHDDDRLESHRTSLVCQTCHLPAVARKHATKVSWDWSKAGDDRPEDEHRYLKKKGEFVYQKELWPTYRWFNGTVTRYQLGQPVRQGEEVSINRPRGTMTDPEALIWPFKIHMAKQPFDLVHRTLLVPKTAGEDGYWQTFDWDRSLRLGAESNGLAYSGSYDFIETSMYWPLSHMIPPAEEALSCHDCHGEPGRMDWLALGYPGDPLQWGGRRTELRMGRTLP